MSKRPTYALSAVAKKPLTPPVPLFVTMIHITQPQRPRRYLRGHASVIINNGLQLAGFKIVETPERGLFVRSPSQVRTRKCEKCSKHNRLRATFCYNCRAALKPVMDRPEFTPIISMDEPTQQLIHGLILIQYNLAPDKRMKPKPRPQRYAS